MVLCYAALMKVQYRPFAGAIRQFLREREITQNQLADLIGTQRSHLSRVINGQVPLTWDMGHRIAVGLGVSDDAVMEALPVELAAAS